ncbi:MAG TPA: hypothetical protein VJ725_34780 [Thermoanaerobaculia bacterium]|nr:hypothetical protein [Thermoanaerobaculia bacterium]
MEFSISDIWTAGGVILGFQAASLAWRISQESEVATRGDLVWLPPADYLNLLAMATMALGVFVASAVGWAELFTVRRLFGASTLLFLGHGIALAGHYELYNPRTTRSFQWFPLQERVAVALVIIGMVTYFLAAW